MKPTVQEQLVIERVLDLKKGLPGNYSRLHYQLVKEFESIEDESALSAAVYGWLCLNWF